MSEMGLERREPDFTEQDQDVVPGINGNDQDREAPFEADAADAADQGREVGSDEDEYR